MTPPEAKRVDEDHGAESRKAPRHDPHLRSRGFCRDPGSPWTGGLAKRLCAVQRHDQCRGCQAQASSRHQDRPNAGRFAARMLRLPAGARGRCGTCRAGGSGDRSRGGAPADRPTRRTAGPGRNRQWHRGHSPVHRRLAFTRLRDSRQTTERGQAPSGRSRAKLRAHFRQHPKTDRKSVRTRAPGRTAIEGLRRPDQRFAGGARETGFQPIRGVSPRCIPGTARRSRAGTEAPSGTVGADLRRRRPGCPARRRTRNRQIPPRVGVGRSNR